MVQALGLQAALRGDCVVYRVRVNRLRTRREMVYGIKRERYEGIIDQGVIDLIPQGGEEVVDVHFFKRDRKLTATELSFEFRAQGLKADPYAQAAVDEVDPEFVKGHPNLSIWMSGADGCSFGLGQGEHRVLLNKNSLRYGPNWWFAGVPL
jgi:hypothetical protein